MAGRTPGSCRFAPYFKVQVWQQRVAAWKDIQRAHATAEEARAAAPPGAKYRLVTVSEGGRAFGAPEVR